MTRKITTQSQAWRWLATQFERLDQHRVTRGESFGFGLCHLMAEVTQ